MKIVIQLEILGLSAYASAVPHFRPNISVAIDPRLSELKLSDGCKEILLFGGFFLNLCRLYILIGFTFLQNPLILKP